MAPPHNGNHDIVILYDNDVHCAVEGYAKVKALRKEWSEKTPYITVVSSGDFLQGDIIGAVTRGASIVRIMNQVPYDVVTLGNHEFDYGISRMFEMSDSLTATVVDCNFRDLRTHDTPFPPYKIIHYGDVDIAFVGFSTPATYTSSSPAYFQDSTGTYIYDFSSSAFIQVAQNAIDAARREGADYVVALTHLGDVIEQDTNTSVALIAHTKGIDVVLDGHSHSVIADSLVANREGKNVHLSSTGTAFQNIGVLTISPQGQMRTQLISNAAHSDSVLLANIHAEQQGVLATGERIVGRTSFPLSDNDSLGNRAVRNQETALGNFCADAFRTILGTDIAILNGGGFRAGIPVGEISFNSLRKVFPFGNTCCSATITGQQLLDALEFCVSLAPTEGGNFPQVSGMRFTLNTSVASSVTTDPDGLFLNVAGARRVENLEIFNPQLQQYQAVQLDRTYTLASTDYLIISNGNGGILRYAHLLADNLGTDIEILVRYVEQVLKGTIPPLYKQPQGRIVMVSD